MKKWHLNIFHKKHQLLLEIIHLAMKIIKIKKENYKQGQCLVNKMKNI